MTKKNTCQKKKKNTTKPDHKTEKTLYKVNQNKL